MNPKVAVIMGSDSDLPIIKETTEVLDQFKIKYQLHVLSAHRTPEKTIAFAKKAYQKGIKVIIAGAGGAAHLPGIIAAFFPLPVIGLPIKSKTLNGLDSLYSIVQMPPGVPVGTVAINGAKNAALLALEILAVSDNKIKEALLSFRKKQQQTVKEKSKKLNRLGAKEYLKTKK